MITVSYNAYCAISKEGDNDIWTVRPRGVVPLLPLCSQIDVGATVNALLGDTFSRENNTRGSRFHDRAPQFASWILGAMTQSCYIGTCDIRSCVIRGPYCILNWTLMWRDSLFKHVFKCPPWRLCLWLLLGNVQKWKIGSENHPPSSRSQCLFPWLPLRCGRPHPGVQRGPVCPDHVPAVPGPHLSPLPIPQGHPAWSGTSTHSKYSRLMFIIQSEVIKHCNH